MRHLRHYAAHGRSIGFLHDLVQLTKTEAAHNVLLLRRKSNRAAVILNLDLRRKGFRFLFLSHHTIDLYLDGGRTAAARSASYNSSTCLPRRRATSKGSFIFSNPSKVARTTLCGFVEPRTFVRTSRTPAARITARTAPPAITPVPCEAGFISTRPEPNRPINSWGRVFSISGTRIRFFFAASTPFLIARGTSRALPVPKPT